MWTLSRVVLISNIRTVVPRTRRCIWKTVKITAGEKVPLSFKGSQQAQDLSRGSAKLETLIKLIKLIWHSTQNSLLGWLDNKYSHLSP